MKKIFSILIIMGAVAVLLSLGTWQIQRLQWKNEVIDRLKTQYSAPLSTTRYQELLALNKQELPLKYGQITGQFLHDKEILFGPRTYDSEIGYYIITPMRVEGDKLILVQRGWVAENKKSDVQTTNNNAVTVTGLFRKPDWNRFTPENSPENNIWTKLDIDEIAQAQNLDHVAPLLLYAQDMSRDFKSVTLTQTQWYPRNKHLQYAIFWYVMALALLGVFGVYLVGRQR